ncbi:MAG: hypothetical protein ACFFCV_11750 [Promethearchaeota archaeon]
MINSVFLNSNKHVLFLFLTIIPICLYFFWKIGYNIRITKIPILISITCAFYIFLTSNNYIISFEDPLDLIIEKLLYLNLLFFSITFTIIIVIIPSNQNINIKSPSTIIQEDIASFAPNLEWNAIKDYNNITQLENKHYEEELIRDDLKRISERTEPENSEVKFQKLINDIFKIQNKKLNES